MKLRVANKVYRRFDSPGRKYRKSTINSAFARRDKCESERQMRRFENALMTRLGPYGRFDLSMSLKLHYLEEKHKGETNASLQIQAE